MAPRWRYRCSNGDRQWQCHHEESPVDPQLLQKFTQLTFILGARLLRNFNGFGDLPANAYAKQDQDDKPKCN